MEANQKKREHSVWVKVSGAAFVAALVLAGILGAVSLFEHYNYSRGIYLRSAVAFLAKSVNGYFLLPTALVVSLLAFCYDRRKAAKESSVLWSVFAGVCAVAYGIWMILFSGSLLLTAARQGMSWDCVGEDGWLVQRDPDTGKKIYFEDYNWLWKKQYYATADSVCRDMEERYGLPMRLSTQSEVSEGWEMYTLTTGGETNVTFHVKPTDQREFCEDYVQMYAGGIMEEMLNRDDPGREWSIMYEVGAEDQRLVTGFVLECTGLEDAKTCAELAAGLATKLYEDPLIAGSGAGIWIHCQGVENARATIAVPVGVYDTGEFADPENYRDKYTDWSLIYAKLLDNYTWYLAAEPSWEGEETGGQTGIVDGTAGSDGTGAGEIDLESSAFYVEGAYKALYDALFAQTGCPYETTYNAKGNFYAFLAEGIATLESVDGEMRIRETVVYDRKSQNEKCHLFVHYRDYYLQGESSPYTTEIVDMYAVDMATGQVYLSGRHTWSDSGSEAYRKVTGEP